MTRAEERLRRLHAFAAELSAASSIFEVARIVLGAGVGAIGAEIAAVWKVDDRVATLVAQSSTEAVEHVHTMSLDVSAPITLAVRRGEPVFVERREEYAKRFPMTEAMTRTLSLVAEAYACLPLAMNGTVLAVMALAFRDERRFDPGEREFLILIARHASIAFQRALDHQAQVESTRRLRSLQEATDALAKARTPVEVAEATVSLGADAVGALSGALWLEQLDGTLVMQASHNVPESELSEWQRVPASADLPLCRVMRSGRIAWVSTAEEYVREAPEAFDAVRESNRGWGYVALPLTDGQKAVGVLSFSYAGDHVFSENERRFLQALARTCEHALDRARLFMAVTQSSMNKDEFLAMLGHELRNPLAAMVTAMYLLKTREPTLSREHSVLDRQLNHLARMVDDLVDVSRITRGLIKLQRSAVDVASAVEHAIETSRAAIERLGHQVTVAVPLDLVVDADRDRLGQVLANLVNNAVKYTPERGQIDINAHRDGEAVVITVRDNGVGIAPTLMPHLFDMFVQGERAADRKEGGLGVGLTAVRSLVEMHGGTVSASSDGTGKGATFTIRWPRATSDAVTASLRALEVRATRRLRVLVIDENREAARTIGAMISSMGHEVIIEHDSDTALMSAEQSGPHIALVDVSCQQIDGYDLAARLRMLPSLKGTFLVGMTAPGKAHDPMRAERAGFSRHVPKPVDVGMLQSVLGHLLPDPSE